MKILYGSQGYYKDVTDIALEHCKYDCMCVNKSNTRYLRIPAQPVRRDSLFGNPIKTKPKHILLNGERKRDGNLFINLDMHEKMSPSSTIKNKLNNFTLINAENNYENSKQILNIINDGIAYNYINPEAIFDYELQIHCIMNFKKDSKVLILLQETNDNNNNNFDKICHTALVISVLLSDSSNLTLCSTDNNVCQKIKENRDLNEFKFVIANENDKPYYNLI